jgi:hypothetical protein
VDGLLMGTKRGRTFRFLVRGSRTADVLLMGTNRRWAFRFLVRGSRTGDVLNRIRAGDGQEPEMDISFFGSWVTNRRRAEPKTCG